MHAGTYPAHHVHVGGGHVGSVGSVGPERRRESDRHTCVSSQLLYTHRHTHTHTLLCIQECRVSESGSKHTKPI